MSAVAQSYERVFNLTVTLLGILCGMLGAFLVAWPLSIHRMSAAQQPGFSRAAWFAWGVPPLGYLLFLGGFGAATQRSWLWGGLTLLVTLVLGGLLFRHDQYSAMVRILFDDYLSLKKENPCNFADHAACSWRHT